MSLLLSWDITYAENRDGEARFQKTFPDGIDVLIAIAKTEKGFEVKTSVVSRTTDPSESMDGFAETLDDAIEIAKKECIEWDNYLTKEE